MAAPIELSGVSIVCAGSFNPAIFNPVWLKDKGLITAEAAEDAQAEAVSTPDLANFTADWLIAQVIQRQASFSTVEEAREPDLRDLAKGVLDVLPETPVDAVGINADVHFRVNSEEKWHELGDRFMPKDFWQPMFEDDIWKKRESGLGVGLRTMALEASRADIRGIVRLEVAPSVRALPHGVYIGINSHYPISEGEMRGNGYEAARLIEDRWSDARELERKLVERLLELTQ